MANIDQTEAAALLNASLNSTAYTKPTAWYLALINSTFTPTGSALGATANEASGGSYARVAIAFPVATAAVPASSAAPAVTYNTMPAATIGSVEVYTTTTGTTRRLWYGNLSANKTTAAGDTLTVTVTAQLQ